MSSKILNLLFVFSFSQILLLAFICHVINHNPNNFVRANRENESAKMKTFLFLIGMDCLANLYILWNLIRNKLTNNSLGFSFYTFAASLGMYFISWDLSEQLETPTIVLASIGFISFSAGWAQIYQKRFETWNEL